MRRSSLLVVSACALLLYGCLRQNTVRIGTETGTGTDIGREVFIRALPDGGDVRDAQSGRELWFAYGAVSGVNDGKANGVAMAHYLEDETYVLGVQLNIQVPQDGSFYEVWLMPEAGSPVSLGHMVQGVKEGRQNFNVRTKTDYRQMLHIAVSLENDDGNPAQAEIVAEGFLKVTKR